MSAVQQALLGYGSSETPFTGAWVQSATTSASAYRTIVEGGSGDVWLSTLLSLGGEYVARVNSNGVMQWELLLPFDANYNSLRNWGGIGYSSADNSLLVGLTDNGSSRLVLIKIAANGSVTWQRQITQNGGSGIGAICDIVTDASGNIYICGQWAAPSAEAFVACLNPTATSFIWQRRWTSGTLNYFLSLASDSSGNIFTSGVLNGRGSLVKLNSTGVWQTGVQKSDTVGAGYMFARVSCDSSGNVYANTHSNGVSKYNNSLTHQWTAVANNSTANQVSSCVADASGNSYEVCGLNTGSTLIIKRDTNGAEKWRRQFDGYPGGVASTNATKKAVSLAGPNFIALPRVSSGANRLIRLPTNSTLPDGGWPNATYNDVTFTSPGATSTTAFTAASMAQPTSSTTVFNTPTTSSYMFDTPLNTSVTSTVVNIPFAL